MVSRTGPLANPVRAMAELVSESPSFRARVGYGLTNSREDGIAFLLDDPDTRKVYPTVLRADIEGAFYGQTIAVVTASGLDASVTSAGPGWNWEITGSVTVTLTATAQPELAADLYDAQYDAWSYFGGVIDDLNTLNALDDRFNMNSASMVLPGVPMSKKFEYVADERWYVFAMEFLWGSTL